MQKGTEFVIFRYSKNCISILLPLTYVYYLRYSVKKVDKREQVIGIAAKTGENTITCHTLEMFPIFCMMVSADFNAKCSLGRSRVTSNCVPIRLFEGKPNSSSTCSIRAGP